jgi:hypothetical protein
MSKSWSSYLEIAEKFAEQIAKQRLSVYCQVLFSPKVLAPVLEVVHNRLNSNHHEFKRSIDQIEWEQIVFPNLVAYAQNTDHTVLRGRKRQVVLTSLEAGRADLVKSLSDMFVDDFHTIAQRVELYYQSKIPNWMRVGANKRLAPKFAQSHAFHEKTFHDVVQANAQHDVYQEAYSLNASPYLNALERSPTFVKPHILPQFATYDYTSPPTWR